MGVTVKRQEVALEHPVPVLAHFHQSAHLPGLVVVRCAVVPVVPLLEQSVAGVVGAEGQEARSLDQEDGDGGARRDDGDGAAVVYAVANSVGGLQAAFGRGLSVEGSRAQQLVLEQAGRDLELKRWHWWEALVVLSGGSGPCSHVSVPWLAFIQ
jgi:hypothetical protein